VPAVHDHTAGAHLHGGGGVLREELAGGDADPVVRRGDVDDVRGVDEHADVGGADLLGIVSRLGRLVALRVGQEELHEVRADLPRRPERVAVAHMRADLDSLLRRHEVQVSAGLRHDLRRGHVGRAASRAVHSYRPVVHRLTAGGPACRWIAGNLAAFA